MTAPGRNQKRELSGGGENENRERELSGSDDSTEAEDAH